LKNKKHILLTKTLAESKRIETLLTPELLPKKDKPILITYDNQP
jgi:hypothetical protein